MHRLLDFHRRRYWLVDGWSIRFRVQEVPVTESRPHGLRYAFTLHDVDGSRLLGFDNAHGVPQEQAYDHRHRFRRTVELVPYVFQDADKLLCDFFEAVERACNQEGVLFEFDAEDVELDIETEEDDDEAKITE
jgi:hypothetical protein